MLFINAKQKSVEIIDKILRQQSFLSYSSLSAFASSPKDFIDYKTKPRERTPAMVLGSQFHALLLTPEEFHDHYFIFDDSAIVEELSKTYANPRNTNKYKEWKLTANPTGKDAIDSQTFKLLSYMVDQVESNRAAKKILDSCPSREQRREWEYKNFIFEGYLDANGEDIICDVKKCTDASPEKFQRTLVRENYHVQAAMYAYATGKKNYYIIACDETGAVSVHELSRELLMYGMEEYDRWVTYFNVCVLRDAWNQSYDFWAKRGDGIYKAEKPLYL
jgi:exodeoxyribonuclease VIII